MGQTDGKEVEHLENLGEAICKRGQDWYAVTGGGFGNPLERDPEKVRDDVRDGFVSLASAQEHYGVVSEFLKPTAGEILWRGGAIAGLAPHRIARLGIVRTFQLTSVFGDLTVMENVLMASHLGNRSGIPAQSLHLASARAEEKRLSERCREILDLLDTADFADSRAANLAGGTQKILGIANALAADPALLMLDEPLAGLNPAEKTPLIVKSVLDTIKSIAEEEGVGVLLVEQNANMVLKIAREAYVLELGQVVLSGPAEELSADVGVRKAYLGM